MAGSSVDVNALVTKENGEKQKQRKVIVEYYIATSVAISIWWHELHMVKAPSRDLSSAREFFFRRLYYGTDAVCKAQLRLHKDTFNLLCKKLSEQGEFRPTKHVTIEEAVAMFLYILGHRLKIRVVGFNFMRPIETVSRHFKAVLKAVIKLQKEYLVQPNQELEGFEDEKWVWFENCLGALDGTYVPLTVSVEEQGIYRNRKIFMATNVLGVCSHDMKFTYFLPGWEGSAADGRILRDALIRQYPLIVPNGKYFLVDVGYTNCSGFLAPHRGTRYHLNEWATCGNNPRTYKELFNLRHSSARNMIERTFGLLKKRWAILRDASSFKVKTQVCIISACAILHNFIRDEQPNDPLLDEVEADLREQQPDQHEQDEVDDEEENGIDGDHVTVADAINENRIRVVRTTRAWTEKRDALAKAMFAEYQIRHARV